jgi:BON domain
MNEYGRRYGDEPYEDVWETGVHEPDWERLGRGRGPYGPQYGSWSDEEEYAYGGFPAGESIRSYRRHGAGRRHRYEPRQSYADEPYGPAHSPAHMRSAGVPSRWEERPWVDRPYGPACAPANPGRFVGRGPKGYQRSPERILDEVADRLTMHPDVDASEIDLSVEGDVVVLRGRVYDRRQKRMAEDVSESVSGVRDVRNELDVERGILETLTDAVTGRSAEDDVTMRSERADRSPV